MIPRELWADSDRVLPGTGSLPLHAIFGSITRAGYSGYASLELFDDTFAARWADDPRVAAHEAYASLTPYLTRQAGR